MSFSTPRVVLRTPADLLAAVPYLLGFHPADSVVAVGLSRGRVVFSARADLPVPTAPPDEANAVADHLGAVLARQGVQVALIVGYGSAAAVTRTVLALRMVLLGYRIGTGDILRVEDGRYFSYGCRAAGCCPADGTPFDMAGTEIAAVATYAGVVALPDRATLAADLAPVTGSEREAVDRATERAARRFTTAAGAGDPIASRRTGGRALNRAVRRHADGGRLSDAEVGRLTVLLTRTDVRDLYWSRITSAGDRLDAHLALWRDLTRRARPDLVAAPATLFAYASWRAGNGALARVAIDRALDADPAYRLALLLGEALDHGLPPSTLDCETFGHPPDREPCDESVG
ncbi:MAG: hypothetical protein QOI74_3425 [Micromonosporaceae bacterium]|jgi:hypothetical protein|nr:hypothetical protein [Micromonosporaceae bacterium]